MFVRIPTYPGTADINCQSIFKQLDSWNHILSTSSVMKKLLAHFDVFPRFLDTLHSFGLRHHAIGENLPTISMQPKSSRNDFSELCFDIRYPEKNGRSRGDQWSIRHTALYYQYKRSSETSISILIQPPERFESRVLSLLTSNAVIRSRSTLLQHALFVSSGSSWQEYVVSLEENLKVLVSIGSAVINNYFTRTDSCRKIRRTFLRLEYQHNTTMILYSRTTRTFSVYGRNY